MRVLSMRIPLCVLVSTGCWTVVAPAATAPPATAIHVELDGNAPGRVFDGIGAVSGGGATSRLLIDYPEPQRSQILDFLFAPHVGASLQHLKVEIGSDGNSTEGSEPSHMRRADEEDYTRGYEWWLMKEAKRRNPQITLSALAWNFPRWVKQADSQASADYLVKFLSGAKRVHGLDIDYIGLWNETRMDPGFIVKLHRTLAAHHLKTQISADDLVNTWDIVDVMERDPEVRDAVAVINTHYPRYLSTAKAIHDSAAWHKPLWSAEEGPWSDAWGVSGEQAHPLAAALNRNYVIGRMTSSHIWNLVSSYYDALELPYAGLMRANTPWSGAYEVTSPLWVVAHTTQFTEPGWRYLDTASALIAGGGSYVSLHKGSSYSIIVETIGATGSNRIDFSVAGGLSSGPVYVWRSNARSAFEHIARLEPVDGRYSFEFEPNSLYTLTTTTGQARGSSRPPAAAPFPIPYREEFESYAPGHSNPRFLSEINGGYEVSACGAGRAGQCLRQVAEFPIGWTYWKTMEQMGTGMLLGDVGWRNYRVSSDVRVEGPGYAAILGRVAHVTADGALNGYQMRLSGSGVWSLEAATQNAQLASGKIDAAAHSWHRLELIFEGDRITGRIDGAQVLAVRDSRHGAGLAGLGGSWDKQQFDDFSVTPLPGVPVIAPAPVPRVDHPPEDPPKLFVPVASDRAIRLEWAPVPGARGYRVSIGTTAEHFDATVDVGERATHTFRTLTNGQQYYFRVTAINEKGEGPPANQYARAGTNDVVP